MSADKNTRLENLRKEFIVDSVKNSACGLISKAELLRKLRNADKQALKRAKKFGGLMLIGNHQGLLRAIQIVKQERPSPRPETPAERG